jgi:DNA-binding NarL/FixJ family response regulator
MDANPQNESMTILSIGSDDKWIEKLREFLSEISQFELTGCVSTGKGGLKQINRSLPNIIMIDINVPDIESTELARLSKKAAPNSFIIMVSFANEPTWLDKSVAAGATHFLPKPLDRRELYLVLNSIIDSY